MSGVKAADDASAGDGRNHFDVVQYVKLVQGTQTTEMKGDRA